MRPDKPGYWWYKTSDGTERIADIASGFSFELCVIVYQRPVRVSVFECSFGFVEWLGPAHPPKKVDRYNYEAEYGCFGATQNNEMVIRQNGVWIKFKDVKEFLLKGDVFTPDVIETWIEYKMAHEVTALDLRPHPWEFALYYDI